MNNHGLDLVKTDNGTEWRSSGAFICGAYLGDSVTAANIRFVEERYPGEGWWKLTKEPFRTKVMAFDLSGLPDEFAKRLDGLQDYSCLDDELVSAIENEWLDEVMSWAVPDTALALRLDEYDHDRLLAAIVAALRHSYGKWCHAEGDGMYIDVMNPDYKGAVRQQYGRRDYDNQ